MAIDLANATNGLTSTSPLNFATLTVSQAQSAASILANRLAILQMNRLYYDGDHLQNFLGWSGPLPIVPEGATPEKAAVVHRFTEEVRRGFVSVNAMKECVDREASGTVGIEPHWSFTPDAIQAPENATADSPAAKAVDAANLAAKARADRANTLATGFWDKKGVHEQLRRLAERLLITPGPDAESSLRLYIPAAMLNDELDATTGKPTGRKLLKVTGIEDALEKIHLEVLDADQGRVVQDSETLAFIGIKPTKRGEQEVAEVCYLDSATKRTVIQTIFADRKPSISLDLGGRLTMLTVTRKEFTTEQMRASQKALNFAATVIQRNNVTAGFVQDTLFNVDIPGHYEGEGDERRFVADPIERGPLALNSFKGYKIKDAAGDTIGYTPGNIDHREPVDPTPAIKSKQEHYADILGACNQRHALISGDAVTSGESHKQARAEHVKSLRVTQAPIQRAGRWVIETVIAFADALANGGNSSGLLEGLRATFECQLDAGPVGVDERAQNLAEMAAGALSETTTIERNGAIDVDAELARIRTEPNAGLDAELKRAQIYAAWITASVGETFAAKRAGLTPEEIKDLVTAPTDTTTVTQ